MVCAQKGEVAHRCSPKAGGQNSCSLSLLEMFLLLKGITSRQDFWVYFSLEKNLFWLNAFHS